jgi:pyrroloquinoline quinone (PQQ) biosynthesis protein C
MPALSLGSRLSDALSDRRLLTHPFYRRWEAGGLRPAELREYAEQYRHFEAALPGLLDGAVEGCPSPRARQLLQRNLDDEAGQGQSHLELFDAFREEVGGRDDVPAGPAMEALLDAYREAASRGAASAVAAIATYEVSATAEKVAGAWWDFLSEREARSLAPVG